MAEDSAPVNGEQEKNERIVRFGREPRWSLLSVLTWIASREMELASAAAESWETISRIDIRLAYKRNSNSCQHAYGTVEEAWTHELAPSISEGKIRGTGACILRGSATARKVGLVFPPIDQARLSDHVTLEQRGIEIALVPRGYPSPVEWRDLTFATVEILKIWPPLPSGGTAHTQGDVAMSGRKVSDKQLRMEFAEYLSPLGDYQPTRSEVRKGAATKYGDQVTVARADSLYDSDAKNRPRKRGRRRAVRTFSQNPIK